MFPKITKSRYVIWAKLEGLNAITEIDITKANSEDSIDENSNELNYESDSNELTVKETEESNTNKLANGEKMELFVPGVLLLEDQIVASLKLNLLNVFSVNLGF